jgi:hypothetical protein
MISKPKGTSGRIIIHQLGRKRHCAGVSLWVAWDVHAQGENLEFRNLTSLPLQVARISVSQISGQDWMMEPNASHFLMRFNIL